MSNFDQLSAKDAQYDWISESIYQNVTYQILLHLAFCISSCKIQNMLKGAKTKTSKSKTNTQVLEKKNEKWPNKKKNFSMDP